MMIYVQPRWAKEWPLGNTCIILTCSPLRPKLKLELAGAARTQAPSATNYDVGSTTWADLRQAPIQSAMDVTSLGHGSS